MSRDAVSHVTACLPFLQLRDEEPFTFGPLTLWPASKAEQYLETSLHKPFSAYLDHLTRVQVVPRRKDGEQDVAHVQSATLKPAAMTCVSIDDSIPENEREATLVNGLSVLYFALTFRSLYHDVRPLPFAPFAIVLPADPAYFTQPERWSDSWIPESKRRVTLTIERTDPMIFSYLGNLLSASFAQDEAIRRKARRSVQAIRYFVDRYFPRFENPLGRRSQRFRFSADAESILLLSAALESLFALPAGRKAAVLKKTLRSLFELRFASSVEMLWSWIDGFYAFKESMVHADREVDVWFRGNPYYEVNYVYLATKIFVYSVVMIAIRDFSGSSGGPRLAQEEIDQWLDRREITYLFWPLDELLKRLAEGIPRVQKVDDPDEFIHDLRTLMLVYICCYRRHLEPRTPSSYYVHFHMHHEQTLAQLREKILNYSNVLGMDLILLPDFVLCLQPPEIDKEE